MKKAFLLLTMLLLLPALAGCSGSKAKANATSDLGKLLDYVPTSVLQTHQVWFQDPGLAAQQAGFGQVNSYAAWQALSAAQKKAFGAALSGADLIGDDSYLGQGDATYGWDTFMRDCTVFTAIPPAQFTISEGSFNATLIKQKFTAENYQEVSYAGSQYLTWGHDFQIDLADQFHRQVMASFNRVMATDTTIVTAPTTALMQGILGAKAGKVASLGSEPAARALADQLSKVNGGFITTPSAMTSHFKMTTPRPQFHIAAAANWTPLHDYELAGLGYRKDGQDSYLDICVAYTSAADAEADAPVLAARLKSYVFLTDQPNLTSSQWRPLTDDFDLSAPVVTKYNGAATVTFQLHYLPVTSTPPGNGTVEIGVNLETISALGDMLFLVPDPTPYLAP